MKKLRVVFGRMVEKASIFPIKVLSQGMAVPVGHMTHKLLYHMNQPVEFKKLLDRGYAEMANINLVFRFACERGEKSSSESIRLMLDQCRPLITEDLDDMLIEAVRLNREPLEIARVLLEHDAKPISMSHFINGNGAIHQAASYNNHELAALLLKHGADARMKCKEGHEPLEYTLGQPYNCLYSTVKTVKALIEAGAELHADNDKALRTAAWAGELEVVDYLLQAGANKNVVDGKGRDLVKIAEDGLDYIRENKDYFGDRLPAVEAAHRTTVERIRAALQQPAVTPLKPPSPRGAPKV